MEPSLSDALYVEVRYDDAAAIAVVGEFDMTGTARFWASVSEALATHPPSLTVEARGLTFIARALPAETPDRLVDAALAVCGTDATDMFTNRLDLILRGCETDRKPNRCPRSGRG